MCKCGFKEIPQNEFNSTYVNPERLPSKDKPLTKKQRTRKAMYDARQDAIEQKRLDDEWGI